MKILVIGSGGREHAICQSLTKDPATTEIHCAPGNPGIASLATLHQINTENG
ncbi:MAG: phosphoribosylamine--glycine ligase N-terminal domain-containing protein, partial [Actinomycetes bacterium]